MTGGECVPNWREGQVTKLRQYSQEGTAGKVGLRGPGLLEQPSQQGEQYHAESLEVEQSWQAPGTSRRPAS